MNAYRRNTFRDWCADVGYLYLIATAIVILVYFMGDLIGGLAIDLNAVPETMPEARY